jgi:hypothetical protein
VTRRIHSLCFVVLTKRIGGYYESRAFCRFARKSVNDATDISLVFTPLHQRLIRRLERRGQNLVSGSLTPTITDLTPDVLGPLEGFIDLGYKVFSAFGFNEERHLTWRVGCPRLPLSSLHFKEEGKK